MLFAAASGAEDAGAGKAAGNREAFQAYLDSYPQGRYASLARANVARLSVAGATPVSSVNAVSSPPGPQARPSAGQVFKDCNACPEMVVISGGSFIMGSDDPQQRPHSVTIPRFAIGTTEVTQGQWKAVMGSNPSNFSSCGDNCPVEGAGKTFRALSKSSAPRP